MVDLSLREFDRSNMFENMNNFYEQLIKGLKIGQNADIPDTSGKQISNIVLAGMGGSAIGGELLKSFLKTELQVPFIIHRNYGIPSVINSNSLLICSSYSGGTEETLSAFDAGLKVGCTIMCITTGGTLGDKAKSNGHKVVNIPTGMMPREALGYSFTPLLTVFSRMGLCKDYSSDVEACAEKLKNWLSEYSFESDSNPAYDLAQKLARKINVIYTGPDYFDAVGLRFKGQISENAKQHAFCNVFPEFNHNELVGWELTPSITDRFVVMLLRDEQDHPKISERMDIVKSILEDKGVEVVELHSRGETLIERIFSLIQLGDYVSYYLALINEVDPTPIDVIEYMKSHLE